MDISVVLVHWNTRGALLVCLEALFAGKPAGLTMEVLLADNGSSDGTVEEIRRLYPDVQVFEGPKNIGFARAANQALRVAQGRYVLMLHPDIRLAPGALAALHDFMQSRPDAAMAGAQLWCRDGRRQTSHGPLPTLLTELLGWRRPEKKRKGAEPFGVMSLESGCVMVRVSALADIGLLDEAFFLFYEQADWCARLRKAGWELCLVPGAQAVHDAGRSVSQDIVHAAIERARSRYLYFRKHMPAWQSFVLRIGIVLRILLGLAWSALMALVTLGRMPEFRERLAMAAAVLLWHLRGCPRWAGLGGALSRQNVFRMESGRADISACLITRNEEHNVRACLQSLNFVSEIVVLDSYSQDRTPVICREYTDKVFQVEWDGFSAMKNLCVAQATQPWVLVIDADERVTPELRAEILDAKEDAQGFYMPRQNYFLGRWIRHAGWYPDYTLRLFQKAAGSFGRRRVHEAVQLQGKASYLRNPLLHFTYRDLSAYLRRMDRYSTLAAQQILEEKPPSGLLPAWILRLRLGADLALRPAWNFLKMYVVQMGFLDGYHGFVLAAHASFYVLAKYAKVWELTTIKDTEKPATSSRPEAQKDASPQYSHHQA